MNKLIFVFFVLTSSFANSQIIVLNIDSLKQEKAMDRLNSDKRYAKFNEMIKSIELSDLTEVEKNKMVRSFLDEHKITNFNELILYYKILRARDEQLADNIDLLIAKIDSIQKRNVLYELNKYELDSIKKDNQRLREVMIKHITMIDLEIFESPESKYIKKGYYFRKPLNTDKQVEHNDYVDWIYISDSMDVKMFRIENSKSSIFKKYYNKNPKKSLQKIIKYNPQFDEIYLKCNNNENFIPSKSYNDGVILLHPNSSLQTRKVVFSVQERITLKFRNMNGEIISHNYSFVGD